MQCDHSGSSVTLVSCETQVVLRPCSDRAPTVLRLCFDSASSVLRPCSDRAPTVLRSCIDCASTVLRPCSDRAPIVHRPCSDRAPTEYHCKEFMSGTCRQSSDVLVRFVWYLVRQLLLSSRWGGCKTFDERSSASASYAMYCLLGLTC